MPEDLKLSQIGSSQLPPPFRGLHSPGVRKHCQIIFGCYFWKSSICGRTLYLHAYQVRVTVGDSSLYLLCFYDFWRALFNSLVCWLNAVAARTLIQLAQPLDLHTLARAEGGGGGGREGGETKTDRQRYRQTDIDEGEGGMRGEETDRQTDRQKKKNNNNKKTTTRTWINGERM